jgi:ribose/xylose/arabinose/galactoside ABC-type transport system permease subunit
MAYDDSRFRGEPGFRDEPDFRLDNGLSDATTLGGTPSAAYTPGSYSLSSYANSASDQSEGTLSLSRRPSRAQLDDVFDDPEHGDPGRDRMAVHAVWEILLLLAAVGVWYALYRGHREAVSGAAWRELMISVASLGLVTLGMGLSLRAAAPNLAVGPIAYASALFFAGHIDRGGTLVAATVTALLALAVGLAIVILVIGFHVPAWAASLAAAFGVIVWIQKHSETIRLDNAYQPARHAIYWFAGFAVLALAGGFLGLVKPVRRAVGRFRPVADPAKRRGGGAAGLTAIAILGSCAFASIGGVLVALDTRAVGPANDGLTLTGFALGAALLGGTSAFGRRGGVFGTVLAVALVVLTIQYVTVTNRQIAPLALAAGAIGMGLIVTRLIETFGRPRSAVDDDADDVWRSNAASSTSSSTDTGWSSRQSGSGSGWTSPLPARSGDDSWGSEDRWGSR